MSVSIRKTLARVPGGALPDLTWPEVSRYLREHYLNNEKEKKRRAKAADRQRLYESVGDDLIVEMLGKVLKDPDVIELRRQWVEFAKYINPLKRICGELGTVYQQPASRTVAGDENNARYQEVQRLSQQHEVMQLANPLVILHRALLIGPRVRETPSGEREPTLDVVTPATCSLVRDPLEPSLMVGVLFENDTLTASSYSAPKWTFHGYHETFQISSHGEILESTVIEHGRGWMPYLLLQLEPSVGRLIDEHTGEDLVAAHKAIWFLSVLHLKEAKSATVRTVVQGDVSRAMRNQADDNEIPLVLPEGVVASTLDGSMDFTKFLADAQAIYDATAANHGIPPQVLRHGAVASADARELIRVPLRELRLKQQIPFRRFERMLAEIQSRVIAEERLDLAFTTDGWSIDFADPQTPLGTKEALEVFEQERRLTLTSTRAELLRRNPDLTPLQVDALMERFVADELARNEMMRPLHEISGSPAADLVEDKQDTTEAQP